MTSNTELFRLARILALVLAALVLPYAGCAPAMSYDQEAQPWRELNLSVPTGQRSSRDLGVMFVTTRQNQGSQYQPRYGNLRHLDMGHGSLEFGVCSLARPLMVGNPLQVSRLDSYKSVYSSNCTTWQCTPSTAVEPLSEFDFYNRVSSFQGTVCVFIHGFDKTFESSVRDGAHLADEYYRRTGGNGAPILSIVFTWPSQGSTTQYPGDEAASEWSRDAFCIFMTRLMAAMNPASTLNVVAHSMGNRLIVGQPESLRMADGRPHITNLFLCDPDVDLHTFEVKKSTIESLVTNTVYVFESDKDGPLMTSQTIHLQPRLGRPIDPPENDQERPTTTANTATSGLVNMFLSKVENVVSAVSGEEVVNDTPDVRRWLAANPSLERELGPKTRFIDVTDINVGDIGHRMSIPLVVGLMLSQPTFSPFLMSIVHKRPDRLTLEEMGGRPLWLYRFYKLSLPSQ